MRRAEPVRCVVCQDARTLVATEGEQGRAAVLASYPAAGSAPARVLVACPACASGAATPTNYLDDLDVYQHQRAAVGVARDLALADAPSGWLVLTGGYGSGKSTIAAAALRTLRSRGLTVRSFTAAELKDAMYGAFRSGDYSGWLASLKRSRGLCVDELDSVSWGNAQVEEMLSELINARYSQAATTVTILITADLGAVPGRIRSRMAQFRPLDLGPTDLRQADDAWAGAWNRGEAA